MMTRLVTNPAFNYGAVHTDGYCLQLHINTQGSSHWDGPRHYPYQESLKYYNDLTQDDISGPEASNKIGIQSKEQDLLSID